MKRLIAKDLKIKFVETLSLTDKFSYEEGNPFLIRIGKIQYYIFLKNLSSAYFKNSPDIARVQLPSSEYFDKVFKDKITFIILGYDYTTDTMVSWDPKKIKARLNAKSNVSLYSRYSLHKQVMDSELMFGYLANGEKIVLFKRNYLSLYFDSLNNIFKENANGVKVINNDYTESIKSIDEPASSYTINKLYEINDMALLSQLRPLLQKNQVLRAVEIASKFYIGKYKDMTFKDWYKIIDAIYKEINS